MLVKVPIAPAGSGRDHGRACGLTTDPLLPCLSASTKRRKPGVLFASLAVKGVPETEFSLVRYMWRSTGSLGKIFLSCSEKGT